MFDVILISHGPFSQAILESAELICGKQDHVKTFGLYEGDSVDEFRILIREAITESLASGDLLVLTDIMCGSPFNVASAAMEDLTFQHITGVNLPMLIQVLLDRQDNSLEDVVAEAMNLTSNYIIHVNAMLEQDDDDEDDELAL